MADVYKAYHPNLDRYVAIKILHAFLSEKTDILGRFRREAQHIAALQHTNIVQVHDFDVQGTVYYMVMEYIDGLTLKSLIKSKRNNNEHISFEETLRLIMDMGEALSYAHRHGVIHRDVKPANVMIDKKGRVVLTDFGLAKILSGPQFTTTGAMVGTPAYMAPEQGLGQPGDMRSDIYSMGVILYQMVTGRLPFIAETPLAIVFKHVNAPLPMPRAVNEKVPSSLENVIVKTLAKNPEDRYQYVDDVLEELAGLETEIVTGPTTRKRRKTPPARSEKVDVATVSLHVVETGQILALENGDTFVLGRDDGSGDVVPDVDLTPFKGYKLGVSRQHATINLVDGGVIFTDLGSTNGTWVNGAKVPADTPLNLHHGDVVSLGKLVLQVLVRL